MISFVWPPGEPMLGGTGGSETYTAGPVSYTHLDVYKRQKLTSSPRGISASSYKKSSVLGLKCRDFLLERRQVVLNGLSHDGKIHREITVRQ